MPVWPLPLSREPLGSGSQSCRVLLMNNEVFDRIDQGGLGQIVELTSWIHDFIGGLQKQLALLQETLTLRSVRYVSEDLAGAGRYSGNFRSERNQLGFDRVYPALQPAPQPEHMAHPAAIEQESGA